MQALKKEYVLINEIHDMLKKSRLHVCVCASVWVERQSLRNKAFLRGGNLDVTYYFVFHTQKIKTNKCEPLELRSLLSISRKETP